MRQDSRCIAIRCVPVFGIGGCTLLRFRDAGVQLTLASTQGRRGDQGRLNVRRSPADVSR
jgi:hypothetical protein